MVLVYTPRAAALLAALLEMLGLLELNQQAMAPVLAAAVGVLLPLLRALVAREARAVVVALEVEPLQTEVTLALAALAVLVMREFIAGKGIT